MIFQILFVVLLSCHSFNSASLEENADDFDNISGATGDTTSDTEVINHSTLNAELTNNDPLDPEVMNDDALDAEVMNDVHLSSKELHDDTASSEHHLDDTASSEYHLDADSTAPEVKIGDSEPVTAVLNDGSTAVEDDEDYSTSGPISLPDVLQLFNRIHARGLVQMSKLLTCSSEKEVHFLVSGVNSRPALEKHSFPLPREISDYFNKKMYKVDKVKPEIVRKIKQPIFRQQITNTRGRVYQFLTLVLDCPEWCSQPIGVSQLAKNSPKSMLQSIIVAVVCPSGQVPKMKLDQNTFRSDLAVQSFQGLVLHRIKDQ